MVSFSLLGGYNGNRNIRQLDKQKSTKTGQSGNKGRSVMKKTNIIIRISERDKEELKRQAAEKEMTMSEYILYLIHREEKSPE